MGRELRVGARADAVGGPLRTLAAWPVRSLAARIISSIFATAFVTSVVVTWIPTRTMEAFLREEVDAKFPAILGAARERLDLWYSRRELDLETFAGSATLQRNADELSRVGEAGERARTETARYLSYVLERFPQYASLFVLAPSGDPLLEVGGAPRLSPQQRRALTSATGIGSVANAGGERVQIVSAPIARGSPGLGPSLHARVRLAALQELLDVEELGAGAGFYLVEADGEVLLATPGAPARRHHPVLPVPGAGDGPGADRYTHEDGVEVVGSALPFSRFGWTLVVEEPYDEAFAPVVRVLRETLGINLAVVGVFVVIAYLLARSIVRPIHALSEAARRIATGQSDVIVEGADAGGELGVLTRAFNEMSGRLRDNQLELEQSRREVEDANARLIAQNQELQRVNEVFQQLSITDDLTRLHNHRFFQNHLPREIKRAERTGSPVCLILIDIDDFKALNDRFGHAVGDAVLRKVAEVMNHSIRDTDLLARYGGEEFALLASDTPLEGALALAEKIRLAISAARFSVVDLAGPEQVRITASFGVALFRGDPKSFFNAADRALYRAKAAGKDCVLAEEVSGASA